MRLLYGSSVMIRLYTNKLLSPPADNNNFVILSFLALNNKDVLARQMYPGIQKIIDDKYHLSIQELLLMLPCVS